jgi:6,7-dimethyl-8-ribityllumazine synthase
MATDQRNLSDYDLKVVPPADGFKFGIVVSEWNFEITKSLSDAACQTLKKHGVREEDILKKFVPGSFELTLGAQFMAEYCEVDAIICVGCVIRGETPHFDYICESVTHGITALNLTYNIPFIFGVLTTNTLQQARDRAGGKYGNKGDEAAITAIKMAALQRDMIRSAGNE